MHGPLLQRLFAAAADPAKAQKRLLASVEQMAGAGPHADVLLKRTPALLKALYDLDLLEEDVVLRWFDRGSKKKLGTRVREAAAPFVQWLREADEEESEG